MTCAKNQQQIVILKVYPPHIKRDTKTLHVTAVVAQERAVQSPSSRSLYFFELDARAVLCARRRSQARGSRVCESSSSTG
jgi:hypothetical protein